MAMPQCYYLAKGAKRPSHTTNMQTLSNKSSFYILAVTTLKASKLNSALWDQIFIFCCMNRPHPKTHVRKIEKILLRKNSPVENFQKHQNFIGWLADDMDIRTLICFRVVTSSSLAVIR